MARDVTIHAYQGSTTKKSELLNGPITKKKTIALQGGTTVAQAEK